jgi:hypothetical protein
MNLLSGLVAILIDANRTLVVQFRARLAQELRAQGLNTFGLGVKIANRVQGSGTELAAVALEARPVALAIVLDLKLEADDLFLRDNGRVTGAQASATLDTSVF